MVRVGVILSGCGVQDGSEIHEAVLTLLALDEAGADVVCIAPNKLQTKVVNHHAGEPSEENRNVLVESARIARGEVTDIAEVEANDLDAVVLPGGFGAALNLCDFALMGEKCSVDPQVDRLLRAMHDAGKPIGSVCISPVILARVLGEKKPRLTIGVDKGTAAKIEHMGARHVDCTVDGVIVDEENRLATSPAYMLAGSIKELKAGITAVVGEVMKMAAVPVSS